MPKETPTPSVTPLLELLRACDDNERTALADMAGTEVNYLYSLAGCHRGQPKLKLGLAIAQASVRLNRMTHGRTPVVTPDQLATMCDVGQDR